MGDTEPHTLCIVLTSHVPIVIVIFLSCLCVSGFTMVKSQLLVNLCPAETCQQNCQGSHTLIFDNVIAVQKITGNIWLASC